MLLLCPMCSDALTRESSTIRTPLFPPPLQKSVKLSGCWTGMGMALYPSRSWAWQCVPWDTCPVRWSWRLSCNALTWMVSPRCWFFSVTGGGELSQCIAVHVFGSKSLRSPRKDWGGSHEMLPFTTARKWRMTVSHQPPVDKPASQATRAREMEHLLFDWLIQLGEDRPALATFLCRVANGLLQGCCNLSFLGSSWSSDSYWEMTWVHNQAELPSPAASLLLASKRCCGWELCCVVREC